MWVTSNLYPRTLVKPFWSAQQVLCCSLRVIIAAEKMESEREKESVLKALHAEFLTVIKSKRCALRWSLAFHLFLCVIVFLTSNYKWNSLVRKKWKLYQTLGNEERKNTSSREIPAGNSFTPSSISSKLQRICKWVWHDCDLHWSSPFLTEGLGLGLGGQAKMQTRPCKNYCDQNCTFT